MTFRAGFAALLLLLAAPLGAEQSAKIGDREAHYVVFPSTFLNAEIAHRYDLRRAKDLSILNLSIVDAAGKGVPATLDGQLKNLLGQLSPLRFREIREDAVIYYIAEIRHSHREVLRFDISIAVEGAPAHKLEFQQELFWDE